MRFLKMALLAGFALTGCSTMTNGTGQPVFFSTPTGIEDVSCQVKSDDFLYDIIAPTTKLIERQNKILYVSCTKPGYEEFVTEIVPRIAGTEYAKNIWNGVAPGLVLDTISGASYSYPVQVDIELIPLTAKKERMITLYEDAPTGKKVMPADDMYQLLQGEHAKAKEATPLDQAMVEETLNAPPAEKMKTVLPITDDYAPIALQPKERSVIVNSLEDALPE